MAGLGDLSANAICHHLNKPCNSGHVEWNKVVHDTVKKLNKQFAHEDESRITELHHAVPEQASAVRLVQV